MTDQKPIHSRISRMGILALIALFTYAPAHADYWGPITADNKNHYYCWAGSGDVDDALWGFVYTFDNFIGPGIGVDLIPWSCESLVDAWYSNTLSSGEYGNWTCVNLSGTLCIESTVRINPSTIQTAADTLGHYVYSAKWKVWCHETGHSFGMQHKPHSGQCMVEGLTALYSGYDSDQLGHLENDLP
jgi:hypothetical protein